MIPMPSPTGSNRAGLFLPEGWPSSMRMALDARPGARDQNSDVLDWLQQKLKPADLQALAELANGGNGKGGSDQGDPEYGNPVGQVLQLLQSKLNSSDFGRVRDLLASAGVDITEDQDSPGPASADQDEPRPASNRYSSVIMGNDARRVAHRALIARDAKLHGAFLKRFPEAARIRLL